MNENYPAYSYQVFQSSWKYFAFATAICCIPAVVLYASISGGSDLYFAFAILALAFPFALYFTFLGLIAEPLIVASSEAIQFRSPLFPWRKVIIPINQIASLRADVQEGGVNDLVVTLRQPLKGNEAKAWRLKRGSKYHFDLTISQVPVQVVISILSDMLAKSPLELAQNLNEIRRDSPRSCDRTHRKRFPGFTIVIVLYGFMNLTLAVCFVALTFIWHLVPGIAIRYEGAPGYAFIVVAIAFVPFITTYSNLGLNTAYDSSASAHTARRHAALRRTCPMWTITWYIAIGFMAATLIACTLFNGLMEPMFAFLATISYVIGNWFLFAYPIAQRLFDR